MRALLSLREALGVQGDDVAGFCGTLEPAELDQVIRNVDLAVREFQLTAWVFDEKFRARLGESLLAFREEVRRARGRGEHPPAVRIKESFRHLEVVLRHAARNSVREFWRWHVWPLSRERDGEDSVTGLTRAIEGEKAGSGDEARFPPVEARGRDTSDVSDISRR